MCQTPKPDNRRSPRRAPLQIRFHSIREFNSDAPTLITSSGGALDPTQILTKKTREFELRI
ncbi:MAG: hypothetical protein DMF11_14345 [Verrucomicrobia bacterium]|nr:MAG: hypothetical protein DMF11_14345 [Verrucomicrobiota bacterium]